MGGRLARRSASSASRTRADRRCAYTPHPHRARTPRLQHHANASPLSARSLRRASGRLGPMSLSAEQEADCQEAFTLFDRGGAGKLKVAELGGVLRALGHNLAGDELSVLPPCTRRCPFTRMRAVLFRAARPHFL